MAATHDCNNIIVFGKPGYGRKKDCPSCGSEVFAETYFQQTTLCHALVCSRCGKSYFPERHCRCGSK